MSIKELSEQDRPREKMLAQGRSSLTDSELIAILIGSGSREESAVQLSQRILTTNKESLDKLGKLSIKELTKFKGIGEAKAITIIAALELGRRRKEEDRPKVEQIQSSKDAFTIMQSVFMDLPHEEFWLLCLNRRNQVIKKELIGKGGVSGTVADVKLIFKTALEQLASGIIVLHNHPSGNLTPSNADKQLTNKIKEAGKLMDIPLLDHLIMTDYEYLSFADESIL